MEKGQICTLTIDDMSDAGAGIGRADGMAVFVNNAVMGDTVKAELTKVKKNYAFAKMVELVEPSPYRIEPECQYAGQCGGCGYAKLNYEGQLILKEKQVKAKLTRLGGLEDPKVNQIVGMEHPYNYRNKAQMPVSTGGIITRKGGIIENLGEPTVGFFKAKSHEVVNCESCMLQSEPAMAIAQALREFMESDNITGYDPKWDKGLMKHLVVKTAMGTGEVMAILVINGKGIPNGQKLVEMMDDAIYNLPPREDGVEYSLESVIVNVNKGKTTEIMGQDCMAIAGKPTILEQVGDMQFEISPLAFYQVNPVQMKELYDLVLKYADLKGDENILDLYCGVGTIGLYCANDMRNKCIEKHGHEDFEKMGRVVGIESVKGAVVDANRNAVINRLVNAQFMCGKAEEEIDKVLEGYTDKDGFAVAPFSPDVIILDPPRSGCAPELLEAAAKAAPEKIVYVSCDPATLARDIKILGDMGYKFVEATPVDMFPHTHHVETVCLLSNRKSKPDSYVDLSINMEDYHRIKNEEK